MKWVIVLLVVANFAFFGWQLARDREMAMDIEPVAPATTTSAMVNRLLLLSELERGVLRPRRSLPPAQPRPAPQPASQPEPAVAIAKVDSATTPGPSESGSAATADPGAVCYTIGPLDKEDDISALSAWFDAQGSRAKLRTDERREVVSTWVFLPPLESREAAAARVLEMQARNIEDIYVIPRGDMANAISLGLYSQDESLRRRVAELEERGFTPSVLPRYRTVMASWFDVVTSATQPMTVGVLDQIFPDLIIREVACGEAPIAGDPAISYNSGDSRQEGGDSDTASQASGRSRSQ
ncbi:MAG: hypothetical protein GTO67_15885 [Gammaproteobacteria bacterium]|nr:hypothetical protein [Gammaproteobacteria bacterium]NIM73193.1 hypothetical protein [Gammaproteobacteria bacterium]NIN40029.1 hypothetical protein [Gammaproteobacteria bacterium]NIO26243.1 hypothetical protein [Gammaproteobacteria bacterium]NIO66052.1 hypothetical protein [Gammaproteobacteria bacterium]